MNLGDIVKTGIISRPQKVVLYGPNGGGKTTTANEVFPDPIFIDTEDGSTHQDLHRIRTSTEESFFEALQILSAEKHSYKTLVIDTITGAEKFLRARLLKRQRVKHMEDTPYGKNWIILREDFESLLSNLDRFIQRGMHVVVNGHSMVK